jgi:hypothetical protein
VGVVFSSVAFTGFGWCWWFLVGGDGLFLGGSLQDSGGEFDFGGKWVQLGSSSGDFYWIRVVGWVFAVGIK